MCAMHYTLTISWVVYIYISLCIHSFISHTHVEYAIPMLSYRLRWRLIRTFGAETRELSHSSFQRPDSWLHRTNESITSELHEHSLAMGMYWRRWAYVTTCDITSFVSDLFLFFSFSLSFHYSLLLFLLWNIGKKFVQWKIIHRNLSYPSHWLLVSGWCNLSIWMHDMHIFPRFWVPLVSHFVRRVIRYDVPCRWVKLFKASSSYCV